MKLLFSSILLLFTAFYVSDASATNSETEKLFSYVMNNDSAEITSFINNGGDVNSRNDNGDTMLLVALKNNHIGLAKKLIDAGADVNAPSSDDGMTPLIVATSRANQLQKESTNLMEQLSSDTRSQAAQIKLEEYVVQQMTMAAKIVKMLIDMGADINQETPYGTPLMNAVTNSWNKNIIDTLINAGADINMQDRSGRTALFYAELSKDNQITSKLLSDGADINIKDSNGHTYLETSEKDFILK